MRDTAARVERVIRGVVAAAVRESGSVGVLVLEDWTPEGELVYEWLVRELGETAVLRAAAATATAGILTAHPLNRTALLLGGAPPRADLLPLGDVYASQVQVLAAGWSAPPEVEAVAAAAGGVATLDAALSRWIDGRRETDAALDALGADVAQTVLDLYDRGRFFRLRPRLVPKLGPRTLGIDLWD
jgi:hypothetical protein